MPNEIALNKGEQAIKPGGKKRSVQPRHCQTYTRKRVAEALPEIVERFVEEAKKGSIPHAKVLTLLSGLDRRAAATETPGRKGESLAALLMKELKNPSAQQE